MENDWYTCAHPAVKKLLFHHTNCTSDTYTLSIGSGEITLLSLMGAILFVALITFLLLCVRKKQDHDAYPEKNPDIWLVPLSTLETKKAPRTDRRIQECDFN